MFYYIYCVFYYTLLGKDPCLVVGCKYQASGVRVVKYKQKYSRQKSRGVDW